MDVRVRNVGTKTATGARLSFMIAARRQPATLEIRRPDATGSSREPVPLLQTLEPSGSGGPVEWTYTSEALDLPVGVTEHRQYVVTLAGGGYPLQVRVQHADAPGGGVELRGELGTEGFFGRGIAEAFRPEPLA